MKIKLKIFTYLYNLKLCYKCNVYINFMYFIEFMILHKSILYHVIFGSFYKSCDK